MIHVVIIHEDNLIKIKMYETINILNYFRQKLPKFKIEFTSNFYTYEHVMNQLDENDEKLYFRSAPPN